MDNPNPLITAPTSKRFKLDFDNGILSHVTQDTIFELIRNIKDPEHPQSLEELSVVSSTGIKVYEDTGAQETEDGHQISSFINLYSLPIKNIIVEIFPTIPHCSMASLIGLTVTYQLWRYISKEYYIRVIINESSHVQSQEITKQLCDKDRVLAAFENENILEIINECLSTVPDFDITL